VLEVRRRTQKAVMRKSVDFSRVGVQIVPEFFDLLKSGAPFEVEIGLETDPASPSGYLWSSGRGPDISIDVGTMASADVVVGKRRVISLALPVFDHIFRWLEAY